MSRAIGTPVETAVVNVLRASGWPHAERRALHGSKDLGDVTGTPGLCWEVKGGNAAQTASDGLIDDWLVETEEERKNAKADYGILVLKRKGVGLTNAGNFWAIMWLGDFYRLLNPDDWTETLTYTQYTPVRVRLHEMTDLLRRCGYGDPHAEAADS